MAKRKRQTIQWSKEKDRQYNDQMKKTDNTMIKRKRQTIQWTKEEDRQYNGQKKKTDNTMIKRKRQTIQWPKEAIVLSVFFFWPLYCLSFSFDHCIVCLFLLVIVLSVFFF
jgi:hypothetical protein